MIEPNHITYYPSTRTSQKIYHFPNGFGASVISSPISKGSSGTWELGLLRKDELFYNEEFPDTIGSLNEEGIQELLIKIKSY